MSILVPVLCWLCRCGSVAQLELKYSDTYCKCSFAKGNFGCVCFFVFPYECIFSSSAVKSVIGILMGIALDLRLFVVVYPFSQH